MFCVKLIVLALALVAGNVAGAASETQPKRSQCALWRAKYKGQSTTHQSVVVKVMKPRMTPKTQKAQPQDAGLRRRNTPPHEMGMDIAGGPHSVCDPERGYDTKKITGACLWTGQRQSPEFTKDGYYPGWVNGDHKENCYRKLWLKPDQGPVVYAPVIDGCAFANEGQTISEDDGCATIWVTRKLFTALGGKKDQHSVWIHSWDFEKHQGPGN
ncbi:hypothetical protein PTTG_05252 [Puccinia triticina 1-1 BBBD Race 1]|uniref:Secreted protein n=2 Tax=Puccinia triticina (isolate 1-1 / race 1 (BBBD)) TaxID=630390 RepID=A0A180GA93_PUCT1|nr:hypothetical protein PTTG_05252 [Puccinia triticina 1-1 BBBD Race 1]WAR53498.1 hypothetical protein PtB15_3B6 [Puccinia triticina]